MRLLQILCQEKILRVLESVVTFMCVTLMHPENPSYHLNKLVTHMSPQQTSHRPVTSTNKSQTRHLNKTVTDSSPQQTSHAHTSPQQTNHTHVTSTNQS
ncbi:hypothetical protein FKM82_030138 [Ascaphus truei]